MKGRPTLSGCLALALMAASTGLVVWTGLTIAEALAMAAAAGGR